MFIEIPTNRTSALLRKRIYGIGINDADYKVQPRIDGKHYTCPYYQVWKSMFVRCYSEKFHANNQTYKDCEVSKEWVLFSTFKKWMKSQDWQGKELDKDILKPGNRVYSSALCRFVSKEINGLLHTNEKTRGIYPIGVVPSKKGLRFEAQMGKRGATVYLGSFLTVQEASDAYIQAKVKRIIEVSKNTDDLEIRSALMDRATIMLSTAN